jgi:hypothetical protein
MRKARGRRVLKIRTRELQRLTDHVTVHADVGCASMASAAR